MKGELIFRDIKTPFEGAVVRMNNWWHTKDGKGVFYKAHPKSKEVRGQYNHNESVTRSIGKRLGYDFDIEFVPVAYVPEDAYMEIITREENTHL